MRLAWSLTAIAACWLTSVLTQAGAQPVPSIELGDATSVEVQSGVCKSPDEPPGALRVNRVVIEGRWAGQLDLPLKPGDPLTAENASASLNKLREAISQSSAGSLDAVGEIRVVEVDADCVRQPDGSVDFILRPRYLGLSIVRIGDNVLPIPRWREPTPYEDVPPVVRSLLPAVGAGYDDISGMSLSASISPRLYHEARTEGGHVEKDVTAVVDATHALDASMYSDHAKLAYAWNMDRGVFRSAVAALLYSRERKPLDERDYDHEALGVAVGSTFKLRPNTRLYVDAGYDRQTEELGAGTSTGPIDTSENETWARTLFEAIPRPWLGFARAALWVSDSDDYQRLVARGAYAKELRLRPNQTLGIELTLGLGRAWGEVPDYARFFGGSSQQEFLYDGASSSPMLGMPGGPILRSFGENAAHLPDTGQSAGGGTRFWHANLNVTVPIPRWSMPLIPDESADVSLDDTGESLTVKQLMMNQVNHGPNLLQPVLKNRGMSAEEARRQAQDIFAEVTPAASYVINDANVFAVKPMFLIDVAGISDDARSETWVAAGLGVQVIVITARFEAGYARTLSGPTFGSRGAAFARLTFQRLF